MSFLQPLILFGLPFVALPILIHLINQWRHRTVPWGAMMFLMTAKRMTRGMAKLRQYLIMAMRMLAILGLLFAASRPLASGWLGLAAGHPDTTIIILDRSASMEQQNVQTGESKRSTSIEKLVELMDKLGTDTRLVLIENTKNETQEISSAKALLDLPDTAATSTASDIPGMAQTAMDYIVANQTGRTDIWICSDLKRNDWSTDSGRWKALNSSFQKLEGVRFHLLSYETKSTGNLSVWAENVRLRKSNTEQELVMDIKLRRDKVEQPLETKVPLSIVINGARSVIEIDMAQDEYALQGHAITIDDEIKSGWGRIELPRDTNPEDNAFHFVFAEQPARHTVIVSNEATTAKLLRVACSAPVEIGIDHTAEIVTPAQVAEIEWDKTALILWNAPIPTDLDAKLLENFVAKGRSLIFFPPAETSDAEIFGSSWQQWQSATTDSAFPIGSWRDDSDLLSKSRGLTLPVGDLNIFQSCQLKSDGNVLARLENGDPLLVRASTDDGGVYFCSTLPQASHSSLARDGVVFYVMLQRALAQGSSTLGQAQQLTAGTSVVKDAVNWKPVNNLSDNQPAFARPFVSGVLEKPDATLVAINRPQEEDTDQISSSESIEKIFSGLDYHHIKDEVGGMTSLANEIWRIFLILMAIALVVEAFLCLPEQKKSKDVAIAS